MNLFYHLSGAPDFGGSTFTTLPIASGTLAASGATTGSGIWVFLSGSPDLSLVRPLCDTIYLSNPTAHNRRRIYSIVGVDDTNKRVKLDHAPSGLNNGFWRIGGMNSDFSGLLNYGLRFGDTLNVCSHVTGLNTLTLRSTTAGLARSGYIHIVSSGQYFPLITSAVNLSGVALVIFSGINFTTVNAPGISNLFYKCIFGPNTGVFGLNAAAANLYVVSCEIKNIQGNGLVHSSTPNFIFNNYIHDCSGCGIYLTSTTQASTISTNIIANNRKDGILHSGSIAVNAVNLISLVNNTIVNNSGCGFQFSDIDLNPICINNIFYNNGFTGNHAQIRTLSAVIKPDSMLITNFYGVARNNQKIIQAMSGINLDIGSGNPLLLSDFSTDISSSIRDRSIGGIYTGILMNGFDLGAVESFPIRHVINNNGGMR